MDGLAAGFFEGWKEGIQSLAATLAVDAEELMQKAMDNRQQRITTPENTVKVCGSWKVRRILYPLFSQFHFAKMWRKLST